MRQKHEYYIDGGQPLGDDVSDWIYKRVIRTDVSQPSFVLINLPAIQDSRHLRQEMLRLKERLDVIHQTRTGKHFVYTSMGRFDQQVMTKPHRDGGPEESVLILGYKPTPIRSHLFIFDDINYAFDWGVELKDVPPPYDLFETEIDPILAGYMKTVERLDSGTHQILMINNSCLPYREGQAVMLGVQHHAVIENRSAEAWRIVNSVMFASMDPCEAGPVSPEEQQHFLTTDEISK